LKELSKQDVFMTEFCFSTPRIIMRDANATMLNAQLSTCDGHILECGGKRSATPLCFAKKAVSPLRFATAIQRRSVYATSFSKFNANP
jgi:hypothetical protein